MVEKKNEESIRDRIDKKTGVVITYNDAGEAEISMPSSRFPKKFWEQWEADCKRYFNGNRWMKMWHDHQRVQQFNLEVEVEMLKAQLNEQKEKIEEQEEENPLGLLNGGE